MLRLPGLAAAVSLALIVGACGGGGAQPSAAPRPSAPPGDATRGKEVFTTVAQPACATCHTLEGISDGQIGPDLTHVGTVAAERVKDRGYTGKAKDAAGYLRESVAEPNAHVAPACPAGPCFRDIMPKDFAQKLSGQQLADLIAFLLAQK